MDYRLYHAINQFVASHDWLGRILGAVETWAVPIFARRRRPVVPRATGRAAEVKLGSASALASAGSRS